MAWSRKHLRDALAAADVTQPANIRHHGLGHAPDLEEEERRRWIEAQQPKELSFDELARQIAAAQAQRAALIASIEGTKQLLVEHDEHLSSLQSQLKARTEPLLK